MPQVLMKGDYDCGRVCLANACGISYEAASRVLPGQEHDGAKANLRDTMIHHKVALWKLGIPSRIVTDDMIINNQCAPLKTCILVHSIERPTLEQHWCNFAGKQGANIILWWGDPADPTRLVTPAQLKTMYRRGSFNHAHEVGVGSVRVPTWLERFFYWWTVKI